MKIQRIMLLLVISSLSLFIFSKDILAHPGNTASDGCHYCRTRCSYWGVPWNQRHCHGGYMPPADTYITPTAIPKPTSTPTPRPTSTPVPKPTSTAIPTPNETSIPVSTPTELPEVKGEGTEDIQSAEESGDSGSGMLLPLGVLGLVGGYWFYKRKINKLKE